MPSHFVTNDWTTLRTVAVCRPVNFTLTPPINGTQKNFYAGPQAPRAERILEQHDAVLRAIGAQGVKLIEVPPEPASPLQFNIRDAAFVIGPDLFLGRMKHELRLVEPEAVARAVGTEPISLGAGSIEGGDVAVTTERVFVGLGPRTDTIGVSELTAAIGHRYEVVPVPLAPGVLHLDIAMTLLDDTVGTIYRPAVAAVLPAQLNSVDWIELTDDEYAHQAANMLSIDARTVICDERHSRVMGELESRGFTCVPVRLDEITKVGGGIRCMTMPVDRF